MEYRWLKAFLTLANSLNFSRAAAALYITQPALSKQISALEMELGVRLFDRDRHNVHLTDAGTAFRPEAEELVLRTQRAANTARLASASQINRGTLRIAFVDIFPFSFFSETPITERIRHFRQQHPLALLDFQYMNQRDIEIAVKEGTVDIGITLLPRCRQTNMRSLGVAVMDSDRWGLIVPAEYGHLVQSGQKDALSTLRFLILRNDPFYLAERLSALAGIGLDPQIQFCSNWQEMVMRAEMGEGFYLLPEKQASLNSLARVVLIPLEEAGELAAVDTVLLYNTCGINSAVNELLQ